MNLQEAAELLDIPAKELTRLGGDPKSLPILISLAYNKGLQAGQERAHSYYHKIVAPEKEVLDESQHQRILAKSKV
jgi:hypothetical protein